MENRSDSTEADIAKAEAMLAAIHNQIRDTDFAINSEMDHRERSFEAALHASEEEEKQIKKLLDADESFHLLYLPDEDPNDKSHLMKKIRRKKVGGASSKNKNKTSVRSGVRVNDDDLDDGDDEVGDQEEEDDDDNDDDQDEEIPQPVRDPFSSETTEGKLPDRKLDDLWRIEAVLARKTVKGRLFYRVKWQGANFVTWELDTNIEQRALVAQFEAQRHAAAHQQVINKKKLRPPVYISKKRLERIAKHNPEEAKRLKEESKQQAIMEELDGVAGTDIIYSCEVEPHIWIPYDVDTQKKLEAGYRLRERSVQINVNGMVFDINFTSWNQTRNGGNSRRVQRVVVQPVAPPPPPSRSSVGNNTTTSGTGTNVNFNDMSIQELRDFVARAQDLQDPRAYEALNRLQELDKAVPSGVGKSVVDSFPKMTFEEVMMQICNGVEYPSFTTECSICLVDFVGNTSLTCLPQCQHLFHTECIKDFLGNYSKFCPVCRKQVA